MMWMMEYDGGGGGGELNLIPDPFLCGRRALRPLIPASPTLHGADFLALNHHLAMAEQSKRELMNPQQVVVSSRWNPTPEQLQTLEELYRRGTRTPSAEQIQQITAQLRRYGKIEGKNVFYWFQNHKARERLKLRRQLHEQQQQQHYQKLMPQSQKTSPSEKERELVEVEQIKSWATPTNSSTLAETSQEGAKAADRERKLQEGWLHFHDNDVQIQQQQQQMMYLSCSANSTSPCSSAGAVAVLPAKPLDLITILSTKELETLELFPLNSGVHTDVEVDGGCERASRPRSHPGPYQFFEFLPLKN